MADSTDLHLNKLVFRQQRIFPEPEQYLGCGQHIQLTIADDSFQVLLFIIYRSHLTPIRVLFGRRNTQNMGQQFQGGVMPEVPEFPEV
jgi:hypothetical protein